MGLVAGESAANIHARLKSVDRNQSIYKMWGMTDLVEAALTGNRAEANRLAAKIDAQPGGGLVLAVIISDYLCGAPFDLEATPNFKARLANPVCPGHQRRRSNFRRTLRHPNYERQAFILRRTQTKKRPRAAAFYAARA